MQWRKHILLPPAGRAEFIVTGPAPGVAAKLVTRSIDTGRVGDNDPVRPLATIIATQDAAQPRSKLPATSAAMAAPRYVALHKVKPARQRLLYFSERPKDPSDPNSPTQFFLTVDGQEPQVRVRSNGFSY